VSSTATTVSSARRTTGTTAAIAASTLIILLASTVLFVRVIVEVVVVAPGIAREVVPPIALLLAVSAAVCLVLWRWSKRQRIEPPSHGNPTQMRAALVFGAVYALVLVAVAAARHYLGERGVYVAAAISGLTDLDAITLSSARLGERGVLATGTVWRAIVIALLSNLAFKTCVVLFLAGPPLARRVAILFSIPAAAAVALLLLLR
jgi:uncharacterized membrane protein (DUF4010 family)